MSRYERRTSGCACSSLLVLLVGTTVVTAVPGVVLADTVVLGAVRDNTLIETIDGSLSNGAGPDVFSGRNSSGAARRGLIAFDVAAVVPAGSTVRRAVLTLRMSRTSGGPEPVELHRALASWGEGVSSSTGGQGAPSSPMDATWIHRFYDTVPWAVPGGDFAALASAVAVIDQAGIYTWGSTAEMVADVQSWVDVPEGNHGWLLAGNETAPTTVKAFDSREGPDPALRPRLEIEFDPPCVSNRPAGHGYWRRQCLGMPASAGGLDPGRRGRGPVAPTEPGFAEILVPCADEALTAAALPGGVCDAIVPDPPADPCARALRSVASTILDICSGRVQRSCPVLPADRSCAPSVGELLDELGALVRAGTCRQAARCAAD